MSKPSRSMAVKIVEAEHQKDVFNYLAILEREGKEKKKFKKTHIMAVNNQEDLVKRGCKLESITRTYEERLTHE